MFGPLDIGIKYFTVILLGKDNFYAIFINKNVTQKMLKVVSTDYFSQHNVLKISDV